MANKPSGSVYLHKASGRHAARKRYTDEQGKKQEYLKYFDTEKLAIKALENFNKSLIKGEVQDAKGTFGQLADELMEKVFKPKLRPSTYRLYEGFLKNHLEDLKKVKLAKLTVQHLEDIINNPKSSLSAVSKGHLRRFLCVLFNHAVRLGKVKENLADKTQVNEKAKPRIPKALTPDQFQKLLLKVDGKMQTFFVFQANTGLRVGEVCGLKWSDIDGESFKVRRQIQRFYEKDKKSRLVEQELKTEKSKRTLYLAPELKELLEGLDKKGEYVFHTESGNPLDPRNVLRSLYVAAESAGLERFGTHTLRHTMATANVTAGVDINVIKAMLGHTNLQTTMIYAEAQFEPIKEAMKKTTEILMKKSE